MNEFRVKVAFHPMVRHGLGSSVSATLPDALQLGELQIVRDGTEDRYSVQVQVSADSSTDAIAVAVERVRELLFVLATLGDAYEIEYWPMPRVEVVQPPAVVTDSGDGTVVAVDTIATVTNHASVVVTRADYTRQAAAVIIADSWPVWLRVALGLNYVATTAREDRPALVSRA